MKIVSHARAHEFSLNGIPALGVQKSALRDTGGELEDGSIVLTDLAVLNEFIAVADGTDLANQARQLKASLVQRHKSTGKQWLVVLGVLAAIPLSALLFLDPIIGFSLSHIDPKVDGFLGNWIARSERFKTSGEDQKRVEKIGEKLVAEIHNVPYEFHFFVDKNAEINACAYPGGVVLVNSGLVADASDDEIAGVVGHEIGHVLHRDTLRATLHTLGWTVTFEVFLHLIGLGSTNGELKGSQMADLIVKLESLDFSRSQEAAADQEGVQLSMKAGYSGDGLVRFFEKQKAKKGHTDGVVEKLNGLFSTHPLDEQRIKAIRAEIEKIKSEEKKQHKER